MGERDPAEIAPAEPTSTSRPASTQVAPSQNGADSDTFSPSLPHT